jgi:quercetin dioxygenase-like cupin family protein
MLNVIAGSGWICLDGKPPQRIRTGDIVWIAPHERHWHGAEKGSFMLHTATSIGKTDWGSAVTDDQYPTA